MQTKQRTITYSRANWGPSHRSGQTLEEALRECLAILPNTEDTRLILRSGKAELRHRRISVDRLYLHVAAWTDREAASIVPHPSPAPSADLSSRPPGKDWDYLDGDGMALVSANHCLTMSSGIHPASIERYLAELLQLGRQSGAEIPSNNLFRLLPIVNPRAVRQVYREGGVKRIDMNMGRYLETAYVEERQYETFHKRVGREIVLALIGKHDKRHLIEEAENVNAKLMISLDSRRKGLASEEFTDIAESLAHENEDDVEIVTRAGHRIKRGALVLKTAVDVDAHGKTVHYGHAWERMTEYFEDLQRGGYLQE